MRARAACLSFLGLGVALLPLAAPAADGGASCWEVMLREVGWDQLEVEDPLTPGAGLAPLASANDLHPCEGRIQPGARMTNGCTMNFVFRDSLGRLYFGTAGHCTEGVGQRLGIAGVGGSVATVVFDICTSESCPLDFSLARIDPAFYGFVDPTLCHWGGPQGVNTRPALGQTTYIYGWGNIYGSTELTRPRPGVVRSSTTIEVTYIGFAQPGDSGSPIVTGDGNAMGVHVRSTLSLLQGLRIDPSQKIATRVDAAMLVAERVTGLDLELVRGLQPFSLLGY